MSPDHLIILPILIPLTTGAILLLYEGGQHRERLLLGTLSCLALLVVAAQLMRRAEAAGAEGLAVYFLGGWVPPFGIVLVLDRLSALMLLLAALLALPALIFAAAGWHTRGQHFHALFQFLLAGVNGSFLTGDLFNLFVFFEVLLAASYGLLLHGGGTFRVRSGLHYIAINLAASLLFLLGAALVYGVTGTLTMAEIAAGVEQLADGDRELFLLGAAFLGLAFLIKAAMWPFGFWLASAYMAAAAPVGAIFALLTKVGVYVLLRLALLVLGPMAGLVQGFGADLLAWGGMATMFFGLLGVLASQGAGRMAGHVVLISAGTILAALGLSLQGAPQGLLSGALFYLVASTLGCAALFLLLEPIGRDDGGIATMLALTADAYGLDAPEDQSEDEVQGLVVPGALAVLALSFGLVVMLLAGIPPLPGFLGKLGMIGAVLAAPEEAGAAQWTFVALLVLSGLATLIGLGRIGIQTFWAGAEEAPPRLMLLEITPVLAILGLTLLMSAQAEPAFRYLERTTAALQAPQGYVQGLRSAVLQADGREEGPGDARSEAEVRPEGPADGPPLDSAKRDAAIPSARSGADRTDMDGNGADAAHPGGAATDDNARSTGAPNDRGAAP